MIKIISQKDLFNPKSGDIYPFDNDLKYLLTVPTKDISRYIVPIGTIGNGNPFKSISKLDIDLSSITQKYICPHTEMEFYSLVPLYLLSNNLDKYDFEFSEISKDKEWNWDNCFDNKGYRSDSIDRAMLGTGYTIWTNASDGSNDYITVAIELENKDKIICLTWNWFNK